MQYMAEFWYDWATHGVAMDIELTPEQSEQVKQATEVLPTVHDPASNRRFVLLPEEVYEQLQNGVEGESLEDLDPETLAAIEEGWAQSEREEGIPIEQVREEFRRKCGI